ncbi:MAG: YifB family Mg chelatase-like AAA ATPase [Acidimicrobiia bacterium]
MYTAIDSAIISGIKAQHIKVEVHTSRGLPGYCVVGMIDTAIRESKERIRSALSSSKIKWPESRITVNLAPANIRKSGTGCELAILVGLLCSSKQIPHHTFNNSAVLGELGLDGTIRAISGIMPRVIELRKLGIKHFYIPSKNAHEARLINDIEVYPLENINQMLNCLSNVSSWPQIENPKIVDSSMQDFGDFKDVKGLPLGCEAMEIMAAGNHHTLLMGSPGIGKTLLAEKVQGIMPKLNYNESSELTAIVSAIEGSVTNLITNRPFRNPHHSSTVASIIGGGSQKVSPGEATRAHHGILFLDELAEFSSSVIDSLREPLETGKIQISRSSFKLTLPANFVLLACSNPCPCAKSRDECICTEANRQRYLRRLSGPLLDRFDIRLEIFKSNLNSSTHNSSDMRERIKIARSLQENRFKETSISSNSKMRSEMLGLYAPLDDLCAKLLKEKSEIRKLSMRGTCAIWRLSRTIADLDNCQQIKDFHLEKAFELREDL